MKRHFLVSVVVALGACTSGVHAQGLPGAPAAPAQVAMDVRLGCPAPAPDGCCGDGPNPAACCEKSSGQFYGSAEYLLWWFKDDHAPALVTSGDFNDAVPGALGQPGTRVLFGGDINSEEHSGGRFTLGYWLDPDQALGVEGSFFFLGRRGASFTASGTGAPGTPVLARPFFDFDAQAENAKVVAAPGFRAGDIAIHAPSRLWGVEANVRTLNVAGGEGYRIGLLAGFRYLDLNESLDFAEDHTPLTFGDTSESLVESFETHNHFYGGQVGAEAEFRLGNLSLDVVGKVALGGVAETINIRGLINSNDPFAGPFVGPGGFLAQVSNIGQHDHGSFAVVPEARVNVGYWVTDWLKVSAGYTFLYISDVARPGEQIDRVISLPVLPPTPPPPVRPTFTFHESSFWAQGIDFGVEFRF